MSKSRSGCCGEETFFLSWLSKTSVMFQGVPGSSSSPPSVFGRTLSIGDRLPRSEIREPRWTYPDAQRSRPSSLRILHGLDQGLDVAGRERALTMAPA